MRRFCPPPNSPAKRRRQARAIKPPPSPRYVLRWPATARAASADRWRVLLRAAGAAARGRASRLSLLPLRFALLNSTPVVHLLKLTYMNRCCQREHRSPRSAPLPASPRWGEEPGSHPQRGRVREEAGTVPAEPRRGRDARASRLCSSGGVRHAHDRLT